MADNLDDLPSLPPPLLPDATAVAAPAAGAGDGAGQLNHNIRLLLGGVQQLQAHQSRQTELIQKLQKSVLTSRSMINELVVANNELKDELVAIKKATQCTLCKKKETSAVVRNITIKSQSAAGTTPDNEIDDIIDSRKRKGTWPVKHSTLNCFSVQQDLVKVRFHHSEKYQHIPIRIPKTAKNKDGTKPCKLCSEGKVRRKTTWMCATCEVPLCTRPLMDEDGSSLTHHARWHSARDLISEHKICHASLKNGRESRKRERDSLEGGDSKRARGDEDADEVLLKSELQEVTC